MQCDRCKARIEEEEEREHLGQTLCDDCYMDVLSPPRTCDPWAVYTSKSLTKEGGEFELNDTQVKILKILEETGGVERRVIAERLQIKPSDLEREIAALRHMEKIRGEKKDGRIIVRLW